MGSRICKGVPQDYELDSAIPKLSAKIQTYLSQKKPFEKKFENTENTLKKYPSGIYNGQFNIMNNPGGYGKLYKNDDSFYIGQFSNGYAQGQGVYLLPDGSFYQGIFSNNSFKKGTYQKEGYSYNGQFKNNLFDGQGIQNNYKQKYEFQGQFKEGKKVKGTLKWKNDKIDNIFEGNFSENGQFMNGGKLTENPFGYYIGDYLNNVKHGKGTYQYQNGIKYIGQYVNGKKEGFGILYNSDESIAFEGQFKNGLPHGKGKALNKNKILIQSTWIQGIDQQLVDI